MRRHRAPWALVALAVLAAGCGNRLSRDEILGQNVVRTSDSQVSPVATESPTASGGDAVVPDADTSGSTAGQAASTSGSTTGAASTSGSSGSTTGSGTAPATGAQDRSPVVFGLINNETGIGARVTLPVREVWQAWAKFVNARGGIKGHPVKVVVADCANNTSLNVPSARDLVEKQGAIALGFECSEISGLPEYALSKRIPVIGSLVGAPQWNTNPMLFPTQANSKGSAKGSAVATKRVGVTKLAILYCVESPTCKNGSDAFGEAARAAGIEVVYQAGTTVTQPDYTSECLQARNRGANGLYVGGLPDMVIRIARSCARQQYKPILIGAPAADEHLKVPELDGMVSLPNSFGYFLRTGSPAVVQYGQAITKYAPKLLTEGTSLQTDGWTAAKVLEKALELGIAPDRPPTTQDVLNGLWSMKNETLDGAFQGPMARTFTRDQPTPDANCVYLIQRRGDRWTAPNGDAPICG